MGYLKEQSVQNKFSLAILFALALSCDNVNSPCVDCNGDLIPSPSRIMWGISIDSVQISDEKERVLELLGEPDFEAILDPIGIGYSYERDSLANIFVLFAFDAPSHLAVQSVVVRSPYSGSSEYDVGLGTPRDSVAIRHGQPDSTAEFRDYFYFEFNSFVLDYNSTQKLERLEMTLPPP